MVLDGEKEESCLTWTRLIIDSGWETMVWDVHDRDEMFIDGYWWLDHWSSNGEQWRLNEDQSLVDAMVGRGERDVAG
ncbi:hypothetical protein L6452_28308 [Arctium lappa]|uniref:Uncharacterized protein n=1 Tax=Arctium lappa TaxID=4217 RepID=A0ACB9A2F6_ARCLA|nr:hypothetical protein L6452_28308 [Arctium lappa]